MEPLSSFFKKFQNLTPPERAVKGACRKAVHDVVGVELAEADVEVRGQVVYLTAPSVVKSEIALSKKDVLSKLNEALTPSRRTIVDIR